MISFYLNDKLVTTDTVPTTSLLDFLRYNQNLMGTKIGCREGDCGTCTVLVGSINDLQGKLEYKNIVSCLTPIGSIANKHIVTIEGINQAQREKLNPVQDYFIKNGATQCGFCTPGFILSATAYFLSNGTNDKLIDFLDGNICRCTGYKSIERACEELTSKYEVNTDKKANLEFLVNNHFVPEYFLGMEEKLRSLNQSNSSYQIEKPDINRVFFAGGTDLMVQKPDQLLESEVIFLYNEKIISQGDKNIIIPASTLTEDFFESDIVNNYFKNIRNFKKLVASTIIRNRGTIGGNIANASPIGDLTIILLALNASLSIKNGSYTSEMLLKNFFTGYKQLAKKENDTIEEFLIPKPSISENNYFNFEKVSKRTNLDIASVNSAIFIKLIDDKISSIFLSAGGIAPIPLFLEKTCSFLLSKTIDPETIISAINLAKNEISPISDVRGSKEYKELLLGQLILTHFVTLFPTKIQLEEVYT